MEFLWAMAELASVLILGLVTSIVLESYRRRHNNSHIEAPAIFEDPCSLKQVPCPSIFDPAEKYMFLIFPAYNEEYRLPAALDETMKELDCPAPDPIFSIVKNNTFLFYQNALVPSNSYPGMSNQLICQVVIIDDGSTDKTKRVAFDFARRFTVEKVRVILLGKNHGKGEAIRKGMLHSHGELLLMLDVDGATKVNDIEKLERQILADARKELQLEDVKASDSSCRVSDIPIVAFGSRAHLEKKALASRKWYSNFLMKGFHIVVLIAAGPGIRDTQCGFKMFARAAARKLFTNIRLKRWCFDVELLYLCNWFKIPMIEISVNWSEIPGSKMNPLSIPSMLWELALMSVGYRTGMWEISN